MAPANPTPNTLHAEASCPLCDAPLTKRVPMQIPDEGTREVFCVCTNSHLVAIRWAAVV